VYFSSKVFTFKWGRIDLGPERPGPNRLGAGMTWNHIIYQNHIFSKNYYEVISGSILTNVTPKHSELSIFWLFIYSLCCYEWYLFVHNLNTTNKNWLWFSHIFQLKINPKNKKSCKNWCKIFKNLSRNDFTIIFWKNMVLVDYIGIFLHFRILLTDWI
jgi:hypothetical protein